MRHLKLIYACDLDDGIGYENAIPWNEPEDMKFFRKTTLNNFVIMGYNTFKSIKNPLSKRINIVVSTNHYDELITEFKDKRTCFVFKSLDDAIKFSIRYSNDSDVFIIGGAILYHKVVNDYKDRISTIYKTVINKIYKADAFMHNNIIKLECTAISNKIHHQDKYLTISELNFNYKDIPLSNFNPEENKYLDLLFDILTKGEELVDRTNIGTFQLFGPRLEFDVSKTFPLLTTKRVFYRGAIEEMLWFLSGSTDVEILRNKNIHIWNGNSDKAFLEKRNLNYREYDMGPTYGFLFKHFGTDYHGCEADYNGKGFDQVQYVIDEINNNPNSRRIMINLWNPPQMDEMTLPACAFNYIFSVRNKYIDLMMTMRSADMFLGVPFNICGCATLMYIICSMTGKKPGKLIINMANCHIYKSHIDAVKTQLNRVPKPFPFMELEKSEKIKFEDFKLTEYNPHKAIKAPMAV